MYGTIGRFRIKPGMEAHFRQLLESQGGPFESRQVPGFVESLAYRMDFDPHEYYLAAVFSSKEAYLANAGNPEQDARYRQWQPLLESEPEWHDGEIVGGYALQK